MFEVCSLKLLFDGLNLLAIRCKSLVELRQLRDFICIRGLSWDKHLSLPKHWLIWWYEVLLYFVRLETSIHFMQPTLSSKSTKAVHWLSKVPSVVGTVLSFSATPQRQLLYICSEFVTYTKENIILFQSEHSWYYLVYFVGVMM
jgi:hypothetical protein